MENSYYYIGANHTVDLVLVSPSKEVLMIVRGDKVKACPSMLAFPGGFVDTEATKGQVWIQGTETHKEAAFRELKEETGLELVDKERLQSIGVFEGNGRDPRDNEISWARSEAFIYLLSNDEFAFMKGKEVGLDDAKDAMWVPIEALKKTTLAFDHNIILEKADELYMSSKKSLKM